MAKSVSHAKALKINSKNSESIVKNNLNSKVKKFYDLMLEENLAELEYRENDFYIYLKRKMSVSADRRAVIQQNKVQKKMREIEPEEKPVGQSVASPINGIFYRSSSPSSMPFVNEGDFVDAGKTLCIVEAMKVMNEIKADKKMKILKILAENGKNVAIGQALFLYE